MNTERAGDKCANQNCRNGKIRFQIGGGFAEERDCRQCKGTGFIPAQPPQAPRALSVDEAVELSEIYSTLKAEEPIWEAAKETLAKHSSEAPRPVGEVKFCGLHQFVVDGHESCPDCIALNAPATVAQGELKPPSDLLPCPFCGSPGFLEEIDRPGTEKGEVTFQVNCSNEDCIAYQFLFSGFSRRTDAKKAWNSRTPDGNALTLEVAHGVIEEQRNRITKLTTRVAEPWIAVENGLPEVAGYYLATCCDELGFLDVQLVTFTTLTGKWDGENYRDDEPVIAWQKVPTPYIPETPGDPK